MLGCFLLGRQSAIPHPGYIIQGDRVTCKKKKYYAAHSPGVPVPEIASIQTLWTLPTLQRVVQNTSAIGQVSSRSPQPPPPPPMSMAWGHDCAFRPGWLTYIVCVGAGDSKQPQNPPESLYVGSVGCVHGAKLMETRLCPSLKLAMGSFPSFSGVLVCYQLMLQVGHDSVMCFVGRVRWGGNYMGGPLTGGGVPPSAFGC